MVNGIWHLGFRFMCLPSRIAGPEIGYKRGKDGNWHDVPNQRSSHAAGNMTIPLVRHCVPFALIMLSFA